MDALDHILNKVMSTQRSGSEGSVTPEVISSLLNQMVETFRSIEVLLDAERIEGLNVLQRPILEASVYLDFILERYTGQRSLVFFYHSKLDSGKKARALLNMDINPDFKASVKAEVNDMISPKFSNMDEYVRYYQGKYKSCFRMKDDSRKGQKNQMRQWYNYDGGINNIAELFEKLGRSEEYKIFYSFQSMDIHSTESADRIISKEGKTQIVNTVQPIQVEVSCLNWLIGSSVKVLKYQEILHKPDIEFQLRILSDTSQKLQRS